MPQGCRVKAAVKPEIALAPGIAADQSPSGAGASVSSRTRIDDPAQEGFVLVRRTLVFVRATIASNPEQAGRACASSVASIPALGPAELERGPDGSGSRAEGGGEGFALGWPLTDLTLVRISYAVSLHLYEREGPEPHALQLFRDTYGPHPKSSGSREVEKPGLDLTNGASSCASTQPRLGSKATGIPEGPVRSARAGAGPAQAERRGSSACLRLSPARSRAVGREVTGFEAG